MKITVKQLRRIIKEEISKTLSESTPKNVSQQNGFVVFQKGGSWKPMFNGKIFPTEKEAQEAIAVLHPYPDSEFGYNEWDYEVTTRERAARDLGIKAFQTPEDKIEYEKLQKMRDNVGRDKNSRSSSAKASKMAKEIANIVGHGVKANEMTGVADLVQSLIGTDEPDTAIEDIANELGNIIMDSMMGMEDEEDELDFDAYGAATEIAAAFGIS